MGGPELTALAVPVDSSRLQRLLRALFVRQARAVAGQIGLAGLDSGQAPDLTGWNAPLAQALKPTLLAYWLTGMLRSRAGREGNGLRSYEPGNESIFGSRKGVMSHVQRPSQGLRVQSVRTVPLQVTKANVAAPLVVPTHFGLLSPRVLDAVDAATFAFCRETNATVTQELDKALHALRMLFKRGLSRGEAGRLLAREVRRIFADPYRAERIAVTESSRFLHGGRLMAARDAGTRFKRWRASADACGSCRALDGMEVGLDEAFHVDPRGGAYAVINFPPFHPFCGCSFEEVV
jgi:hypothetical protein